MSDIGWRGIMVGLVFLVDLIVFADLARAELSSLHAKHPAQRQAAAPAVLDGDRRHGAAEGQAS
jgi:hypothetical protein